MNNKAHLHLVRKLDNTFSLGIMIKLNGFRAPSGPIIVPTQGPIIIDLVADSSIEEIFWNTEIQFEPQPTLGSISVQLVKHGGPLTDGGSNKSTVHYDDAEPEGIGTENLVSP